MGLTSNLISLILTYTFNTGCTGAVLLNLMSSVIYFSMTPIISTKANLTECRSKTGLRGSTYQTGLEKVEIHPKSAQTNLKDELYLLRFRPG